MIDGVPGELGERTGGVSRADVGELAVAVDLFFDQARQIHLKPDDSDPAGRPDRPSSRIVMPASTFTDVRSFGTGFT